jgi:8-oxo-dGTP diphosphatase
VKSFVLGFLFTPDRSQVALLVKNRPAKLAGRLNGLGGAIEAGETPSAAMAREFEEEWTL